jgi:hypothetical protein
MKKPLPVRVTINTWVDEEAAGTVEAVYYPPFPGDLPDLRILQVRVRGNVQVLSYEEEALLRERLLDDGQLEEMFGV